MDFSMFLQASYAETVQQSQFHIQGILLDSIEVTLIQKYIVEVGNLSAYRISDLYSDFLKAQFAYNRCSKHRYSKHRYGKHMADRLTDSRTEVNIKSHFLEILLIIYEPKCIIFFNVCLILHSVILEVLARQIIRLIFQITFITADLNHPGYLYILSFYCQMHIQSKNIPNVLESIQINYDNISYWLYLSVEKVVCFLWR